MMLLALGLTRILTVRETLAGFADPVVIMIAGLFVVGDGLFQTGVATSMGRLPSRLARNSEAKLIAVIMAMVAFLPGFVSSTGTVAVMLPVVVGVARERGIRPSRLLIPLAAASLLGGMLTLIGTPPNMVVSSHLQSMGAKPFGFFAFAPIGGVIVLAGIVFMALIGRRLLPDRQAPEQVKSEATTTVGELVERYGLASVLFRAEITAESPLVNTTIEQAALRSRYGVTVVDIAGAATGMGAERPVVPVTLLTEGDVLQLQGPPRQVSELIAEQRLSLLPDNGESLTADSNPLLGGGIGLAEILLTPRSSFLGKTLREIGFRHRYRTTVLSLSRMGTVVSEDLRDVPLAFGDSLLVKGPWANIQRLRNDSRDMVVSGLPAELESAARPLKRAPIAVGIMVALAIMFVLTSVLSEVISNTATTVLLAPIAHQLAVSIGAGPEPFMMGIALAASTAFCTPIASPVNTLVLGPGGYRFTDFFKVGVLLQLIVMVLTLLLVPLLFPF